MIFWPVNIFAVLLLQSAPAPLVANDEEAAAGRLHVGNTSIRCLRLPCPARGVFEPNDAGAADRNQLLFVDLDGQSPPPPMIGDPAALARIADAWDAFGCVAIDGRLIPGEDDRPVLRVDRLVGPCGGSDLQP